MSASVYLAPQAMAPEQTMQVLFNYLEPKGAYYRFRHIFFNRIAPGANVANYKVPTNVPAAFMAQAVERSPDPKSFVPVPALGSGDLLLRLNTQTAEIKEQQTRVDQLQAYIKQMQTAHESSIQQRLQLARTREAALRARLIKVLAKIERVRARGYSIQSSEEDYHQRLGMEPRAIIVLGLDSTEQMLAELQRPSHYRGRLAELRAKADGSEHLTAPLPTLALSTT